ncbi:unnamed protein product [Withania somnifera]
MATSKSKFTIFEDSRVFTLLKDVYLPINPRFSSIMIEEKNGERKWKRVKVNIEDHIVFSSGKSLSFYDEYFSNYLSKLETNPFSENRPIYSITNVQIRDRAFNVVKWVPRAFMTMENTVQDFGWGVLKRALIEDDRTPIRSGDDGVEFRPIEIVTTMLSLDSIKQIKDKLNVTINDVITGVVIYGTRLYMQGVNKETCNGKCTALVLFNTRAVGDYKSVSDMIKPNSDMPWGNHFTFLPVPLPKLTSNDSINPIEFVVKARSIIKRKRNSASVFLTSRLLEIMRKVEGPEATARYIHATLKHTSMEITNVIGPLEEMSLANHPIKGLHSVVAGPPQSLSVTMVSYVDKLRVAIIVEKDFIDPNKLKSCFEYSFETIFNAAIKSSSLAGT